MSKPKMVTVEVEVSVSHGRCHVQMTREQAEKFMDEVEASGGDMPTDSFPGSLNWDDIINEGDTRIESAAIVKTRRYAPPTKPSADE